MAHLIMENDNMFSVSEAPWHKLGVVLPQAPTIEDGIAAAGLGWEVGTKPLFTADQQEVDALATYRKDTNEILGIVGKNYKALQNKEAFEFFQPFLDAKEASLETAGSLLNGRRVWILAKINRPDSVIVAKSDDRVSKYILLSNSHDGTLAVKVGYTPIRVVCNNTLTAAHNSRGSALLRIKHTGNIVETLNEVRDVMNVANATFEATAEKYRTLASKEINSKDLEKYIKIVFATPKQEEEAILNGEELQSGQRVMGRIIELFENGRGNDLPGVKGTMWAAYNAVTEYLQYERGKNISTRLDSLWFGQGATMNRKALQVAVDIAAAA
jgi:phage/plasmid-like protein (TIGR03299 family)